MKLGVLSDVHGNEEALIAVLQTMAREGVERVVCLGDLVGYNAGPNGCVRAIRALGAVAIAGNHEWIALGRLGFGRCADKVAHAARRTRRAIAPDVRSFLEGLPAHHVLDNRTLLLHGGAGDPERYLRTADQVAREDQEVARTWPEVRLCFFGHTHEPRIYEMEGSYARGADPRGVVPLDPGRRTWVNPGSVDAARKRDGAGAQFALFDDDAWTVELSEVPYDHESSERRARADGYRMSRMEGWVRAVARRLALPI